MPIVLGGNNPNLSNHQIIQLIITKIKNSWAEENPPIDDENEFNNVHFNTDWYDNAHDYVVSVLINTDVTGAAVLGAKAWDHALFFEVHTFCRELSEYYPAKMGNINKEISRILYSNVTGFQDAGISLIIPSSFRRVDEEENTSTVWHSMMTVQAVFMKFVT